MSQYQVLYWGDIPAQVKVYDGARRLSRVLPERYQIAIDRIAMEKDLAGSDEYLNQWHWTEKNEREGTAAEILDAICAELTTEWDPRLGS